MISRTGQLAERGTDEAHRTPSGYDVSVNLGDKASFSARYARFGPIQPTGFRLQTSIFASERGSCDNQDNCLLQIAADGSRHSLIC